jgi:hypothetical protein
MCYIAPSERRLRSDLRGAINQLTDIAQKNKEAAEAMERSVKVMAIAHKRFVQCQMFRSK